MRHGRGSEGPSSSAEPRRMFTTDSEIDLAARHLRRSRQVQGIALLGGLRRRRGTQVSFASFDLLRRSAPGAGEGRSRLRIAGPASHEQFVDRVWGSSRGLR
jgi:hypothetical protein